MEFLNKVKKIYNISKFWTKKNGPEILLGLGIATAIGAVYLAITETRKNENNFVELETKIKEVKENNLEKEEQKKLLKEQYKTYIPKILKCYAPAAVTFIGSILFFTSSYNIQKGRNAALALAYNALSQTFNEYRKEVKNEYGEEVDAKAFKKANENIKIEAGHVMPAYLANNAIIFDEVAKQWTPNPQLNVDYLLSVEKTLNIKLRHDGYLFLEDVYKALAFDTNTISPAQLAIAKHLGWIYNGDLRHVNFGLTSSEGFLLDHVKTQIRNGEPNFWLNFNVDGDILSSKDENINFIKYVKDF